MAARRRRPFAPDGSGGYRLQLRRVERDLLQRLPAQALALIDEEHPSTVALFPTAYPDDPEAEAEFRRSVGPELLQGRRQALQTLVATADRAMLGEGELEGWLQALEVLRLVLGSQLQVHQDMAEPPPGDPRAPVFAVYQYLSALQDEAVQVLAEALAEVPDDEEDRLALLEHDLLARLAEGDERFGWSGATTAGGPVGDDRTGDDPIGDDRPAEGGDGR